MSNITGSVQFSRSVMFDSLRPHESQHTRPPCPLPTPRIYSNSCPLSRWCHPAISSSVVPFSSCPPEFTQTHVHWVDDAIQPSHLLSSPSPPALNPSQHQGLFQWVNASHEVAEVLEFSYSICPSNEHTGLISFKMNWLDLLAVQGTLKSLL